MNLRFTILGVGLMMVLGSQAQRVQKGIKTTDAEKNLVAEEWVREYEDSLMLGKERIDSMNFNKRDARLSALFIPMTFYHDPANHLLRLNPREKEGNPLAFSIDNVLMNIYLNRPDLVLGTETKMRKVGAPIVTDPKPRKNLPDIVEKVAPKAIEAEVIPMDIYVKKPNFWSFGGDYYLQFLQNYVSDNWYKGGESNYSMLGSITMQANYNNKQKVKWENKLELKLGYQTSKGDTIHRYKTSSDQIRYTGKLGLQATKKWYYTLQVIGETQFTQTHKSNDEFVYSDFMSPFKLNFSVGMDYSVSWLKNRLKGSIHLAPLALNWKYVDRESLATRFGLEEGKHSLVDYGSESTIDLTWQIAENIRWKTRLYGYTTYERAEIEWENTFSFQFNKYISTNIYVYPRFDDGVQRKEDESYWQFKEYCSIGFSYSF